MGWSDVYPILTDEMVEEYENEVEVAERTQFDEWFGEANVINRRDGGHVASVSLFWKNVNCGDPDLPTPTREAMRTAKVKGLARRFDPWMHYVEPLLRGVRRLREERSGVTVRVYLAADLAFLVEDLVDAGCEIRLMRHSSIRLAPGLLWRLLAFEDADDLVTILDSDLVNRSDAWLDQT